MTPLATLLMQEGLREAGMPEDVLQVVTGAGDTGGPLVDNVDMIMFTGSTATGKKVAVARRRAAAARSRSSWAARTR